MNDKIGSTRPLPPRIILVAGLHGAGKSTLIKNLKRETDFLVFDDFMKNSVDDQRDFFSCFHRDSIIEALKLKKNIILAETRLCEPDFREEFLSDLAPLLEPYEISWHCFTPDLAACSNNILVRSLSLSKSYITQEETHNQKLALVYTYPSGAFIHPVTRAQPKKLKSLKLRFFFTALLALLALLVAIPPYLSELAATMNSDQLILPDIYESLVLRGESWSSWAMGGALFLVPDIVMFFPIAKLLGDTYLAYLVMTGFWIVLFLSFFILLGQARSEADYHKSLGWFLLFFIMITSPIIWPKCAAFWNVLYHPIVHGGAYLLVLASLLLVFHYLRNGKYCLLILLVPLCAGGTLSDLLFCIYFTFPCLFSLAVLAWLQNTHRRRSLRLALVIISSTILGRLILPWVLPASHAELSYLSQSGIATAWRTTQFMISDVLSKQLWMFASFSLISILAASALLFRLVKMCLNRLPFSWRSCYIDLHVASALAAGWLALLFTGNYVDEASWRYLVFPSALVIILFLWLIANNLPVYLSRLGLGLFLIVSLGHGFSKLELSRPYPPLAHYLDTYAQNKKLLILGDYWTARKTTFLSRTGIRVGQLSGDGKIYHWANSLEPYQRISEDPNQTGVIILDRLDASKIRAVYGEPSEELQIHKHTLYIYHPPSTQKIVYTLKKGL